MVSLFNVCIKNSYAVVTASTPIAIPFIAPDNNLTAPAKAPPIASAISLNVASFCFIKPSKSLNSFLSDAKNSLSATLF